MSKLQRTPFVILGLLSLGGPKGVGTSGYDLKKAIDGTIAQFWSESFGQIYPVLKRLLSAGLIRSVPVKAKGRKTIRYAITAEGRRHLSQWLEQPPMEATVRAELILKLLFGGMTKPEVLSRHLQVQRAQAVAQLAEYRRWQKDAERQSEPSQPYRLIILNAGISQSAAFVNWADQTLKTLSTLRQAV